MSRYGPAIEAIKVELASTQRELRERILGRPEAESLRARVLRLRAALDRIGAAS